MDSRKWFKEAKFGMMVTWGLYALPAGEWKGERIPSVAEWLMQYFRIPNAEYAPLASAFNPIFFDAEEWVKLARDAGMKYIIFTAKHHDGFAMYHSKVSSYNIVDATPFKRDVVAELADACRKYGIRLGLYYSQDLDWNEPDGGGYQAGKTWTGGNPEPIGYWTNNWDFPDASKKNYTRYYEKKVKPQLKEILTGYGDLCMLWFDSPQLTSSPEQSGEMYRMVKEYQPDCLVNSRLGHGFCDLSSARDNQILDDDKGEELFETPATLNDSWGFKLGDDNWKSPEEVLRIKKHLNERGINYLLNVGPDYLGRIPVPAQKILRAVGREDA